MKTLSLYEISSLYNRKGESDVILQHHRSQHFDLFPRPRAHLSVLAVQRVDSGDGRDCGDTGISGYFPVVVAELVLVTAETAAPTAVRTGTGKPVINKQKLSLLWSLIFMHLN